MNKKSIAFLLALLLFSLFSADEAFAHATPVVYNPAASAVLEKIPDKIEIKFSERVESKASGMIIYGPDGSRVDNNDQIVDQSDQHLYRATLKDGGEGTYTVSWQVVSADDGHFTKGAFVFSVGKETAGAASVQSQFQIQHSSALPEGIAIWLELLGYALLLASLVLYAFLWRPARKLFGNNDNENYVKNRLAILVIAGVILTFAGILPYLLFKTTEIQQLQTVSFFEGLKTFSQTVAGSYTWYRAGLAVLFGILFFAFRKKIFGSERITKQEIIILLVLLLMGLMRARVSHAAASHFFPSFSIFVNFIHLIFKSLWVGGLLVLGTTFAPVITKTKNALLGAFFYTAFSKIASIAFGAAGITGAYIIWLHLKHPVNLLTTEWGVRFIILSLVGGLLFLLRLYHQILVDRARVWLCEKGEDGEAAKSLSRFSITFPIEQFIGVLLLFVTSFLIITTPPLSPQGIFEKRATSQGAEIALSNHPYESDQVLVTVGDPQTENLSITLLNEEKSIGPIVAETEKRFEGGFVFPQETLSPPGTWKINIAAARPGKYDAVADFTVDFPKDFKAPDSAKEEGRSSDFFAFSSIIGALAIILLTYLLYRFSRNLNNACFAISNKTPRFSETLPTGRDKLIPVIGIVLVSSFFWFLYANVLQSDFQKLCEKSGHFWNQTVPMREGNATSPVAVTGCSVGSGRGQFHFADLREYRYFTRPAEAFARMQTAPQNLKAGEAATLTFAITDGSGKPIKDLVFEHERLLHAIIVSEDFSIFSHIHPEDQGITKADVEAGRFPVKYTFSKAGRYLVSVDFVVRARHFSEQFIVNVAGEQKMSTPLHDFSREKIFDGYKVALKVPEIVRSKELVQLQYFFEKDGKPVTDLKPYLSAPMHIAIVRADLGRFIHTHGEIPPAFIQRITQRRSSGQHIHAALPNTFGPAIDGYILFPNPGVYHIFGEFKHEGKIITVNFTIEAK